MSKDFGTYEDPDGVNVPAGDAGEAVLFEHRGWKKVDAKPTPASQVPPAKAKDA